MKDGSKFEVIAKEASKQSVRGKRSIQIPWYTLLFLLRDLDTFNAHMVDEPVLNV